MATVSKTIDIDVPPRLAWDALRDWGALHERLVPGLVTDCRLDGADRIVTFFTGTVVREVLVTCDEQARRLVWSVVDGPYTHHNGAAQVHERENGATRFTWTADLLPDGAAEATAGMMQRGIEAVRDTLQRTDPQP